MRFIKAADGWNSINIKDLRLSCYRILVKFLNRDKDVEIQLSSNRYNEKETIVGDLEMKSQMLLVCFQLVEAGSYRQLVQLSLGDTKENYFELDVLEKI